MNDYTATSNQSNLNRVVQKLTDQNLTLPAEIADLQTQLSTVSKQRAELVQDPVAERNQIAQQVIDGADLNTVDVSALADREARTDVARQVFNRLAGTVPNLLRQHADAILAEVRDELWAPAQDHLLALAEETTDNDTAEELIRAGREDVATRLALASTQFGQIKAARDIASVLLPSVSTCSEDYNDKDHGVGRTKSTNITDYLAELRQGRRFWYPTRSELLAEEEASKARWNAAIALEQDTGTPPAGHRRRYSGMPVLG